MKEVLKNVVASTPFAIALVVSYTTKPILYVAKQFSNLGIFLHERLGTNLGKEITAKRAVIKQALDQMQALKERLEAQQGGEPNDNALASIVKGANNTGNPGNVFILGKKDDGNKT